MRTYALVIVDINSEQVDRRFTYAVPAGMDLAVGERVTVPFGPRRLPGVVMELTQETDVPAEKLRPILARVDDEPVVLPELMDLARWLAAEYRCTMAAALRCILPAQVRANLKPLTRLAVRLTAAQEDALARCKRSERQRELIARLAESPEGVRLADLAPAGAAAARALEKKGLAEIFPQSVRRRPYEDLPDEGAQVRLSPGQENAARRICAALDGEPQAFLLHGVTGSGKTEVYIRAVREALLRGKGAILLVPEIALTPQMVSWFRARFGDVAAVLHSALSQGEKYDEWRRIRQGEARVVIGARSAVFAPVESLGLLIVDEEHEGTYRSGTHPCYDAREVARVRCRLQGATLVLGSATPIDADSLRRTQRGDQRCWKCPQRVHNRPLPAVDDRGHAQGAASLGNRSMFSRALTRAPSRTTSARRPAGGPVPQPARATPALSSAGACGYTVHCPHCDVTMTYHSSDETLQVPLLRRGFAAAQDLSGLRLALYPQVRRGHAAGGGEVPGESFPTARVLRMDNDTTRGKDDARPDADHLRAGGRRRCSSARRWSPRATTFPGVTLVGVIMADMSLNLPDYRSEEKHIPAPDPGRGPRGPRRKARPGRGPELRAGALRHLAWPRRRTTGPSTRRRSRAGGAGSTRPTRCCAAAGDRPAGERRARRGRAPGDGDRRLVPQGRGPAAPDDPGARHGGAALPHPGRVPPPGVRKALRRGQRRGPGIPRGSGPRAEDPGPARGAGDRSPELFIDRMERKRRFMALRTIVKVGDDVLRKTCRPVTMIDAKTHQLLDDMAETMHKANGVGLAAPQVGLLRRIVVIDIGEGVIELINPEILECSGEQTGEEGCLSVPDKWLPVSRPNRVKVRALNRFGKSFTMEGEGLLARAFCHEIDHLDGRLFIDVYRDQQKEHKSEAAAQTEPDEKKS